MNNQEPPIDQPREEPPPEQQRGETPSPEQQDFPPPQQGYPPQPGYPLKVTRLHKAISRNRDTMQGQQEHHAGEETRGWAV